VEPREVHSFAYGRGALRAALAGIAQAGGGGGTEALVPAFICESVPDAVRAAGWSCRYYDVQPDLAPSIASIEACLSPRTRVVVLVNYFGFPAATRQEVAAWCRAHRLVLLEDNAHGYLSASGGQPLGLLGDVAVFSLRKTLPIPSGAAAVVNSAGLAASFGDGRSPSVSAGPGLIARRLVRLAGELANVPIARTKGLRPVRAVDEESAGKFGLGMDRWSSLAVRLIAPARIVRNRRRDYDRMLDVVRNTATARPLFPVLEEGICPYAVPFVTERKAEAMERLRALGLRVSDWPGPSSEPRTCEAAERLRASLFCLLLAY
jgi:hypothetical protein